MISHIINPVRPRFSFDTLPSQHRWPYRRRRIEQLCQGSRSETDKQQPHQWQKVQRRANTAMHAAPIAPPVLLAVATSTMANENKRLNDCNIALATEINRLRNDNEWWQRKNIISENRVRVVENNLESLSGVCIELETQRATTTGAIGRPR